MIVVITGPTAVGKTKLSIEIAKKINGEIINADSTQIYQDLDIATAKVTKEEMDNIPHHLIDIKKITEEYTVYNYQKDCRKIIEEIEDKGKTPIIVGGTGLYIKAALYNYEFNIENKTNNYQEYSTEELFTKLLKVDPKTTIHPNNRKRIERALDYYENTKKPISDKPKSDKLLYDTVFIGLTTSRDNLYNRINKRVDKMFEEGLLEEAKNLYDTNIRSKAVMTPIGYKELFDYFDHHLSLEDSISLIKQRSRKYAKRQYTWFNHQLSINWIDVDFLDFNKTIDEAMKIIYSK